LAARKQREAKDSDGTNKPVPSLAAASVKVEPEQAAP
jgi:hypothetical protein